LLPFFSTNRLFFFLLFSLAFAFRIHFYFYFLHVLIKRVASILDTTSISPAHNKQQQTLYLTGHDMETSKQDFHHDENSTFFTTLPRTDNGATTAHFGDDVDAKHFFESTAVIALTSPKAREGM
jgi:hypothetical protein